MSPAFEDLTAAAAQSSPVGHVVLAYGLVWLVLLLFVVALWRRQARIGEDLTLLLEEIRSFRQKRATSARTAPHPTQPEKLQS